MESPNVAHGYYSPLQTRRLTTSSIGCLILFCFVFPFLSLLTLGFVFNLCLPLCRAIAGTGAQSFSVARRWFPPSPGLSLKDARSCCQ